MTQHMSEVARIREQIQLSHQAAERGLSGLASGTARHDFINKRMEHMDEAFQELESLVGKQEAVELLVASVWSKEDIEAGQRRPL